MLQGSESLNSFSGDVDGVMTTDIIGDIINPGLQKNGRVVFNQILEWLVEHQLCNGGCLRAPLQDSLLVVLWIAGDALGLNDARTTVKVDGQLQVEKRIFKFSRWGDEIVQGDSVIKATEVC